MSQGANIPCNLADQLDLLERTGQLQIADDLEVTWSDVDCDEVQP